jgi:hypothetical protein
LTTNYPEEAFTAAFKSQARERFPQAAIYAPRNTVDEVRSAAALAAVANAAPNDSEKPGNDATQLNA